MAREFFQAYHSYLEVLEPLTDAQRGRLFTALLRYSLTGEEPDLRGNERFIFPAMRQQIDRDARRYDEKCAVNRQNARQRYADAGGGSISDADAPKEKEKEMEKEKTREREMEKAKEKEKEASGAPDPAVEKTVAETVRYLNQRLNTQYRAAGRTAELIRARLDEGLTAEDLRRAVDNKCADWDYTPDPGQKDMRLYLRPETLFGPKCENYANEIRDPVRRCVTGPRPAPALPQTSAPGYDVAAWRRKNPFG